MAYHRPPPLHGLLGRPRRRSVEARSTLVRHGLARPPRCLLPAPADDSSGHPSRDRRRETKPAMSAEKRFELIMRPGVPPGQATHKPPLPPGDYHVREEEGLLIERNVAVPMRD